MSHRTLVALVASAIISIGCTAMISTDAFARGGAARVGVHHGGAARVGVYHGGVHRVGVAPVRRGVAVGVGAAAVGAAAAHGAYCGYAPYPPCY
jgi:hypothetical protein